MTELSDAEREMLAIEAKWWQYAGLKEQHVRDTLDMSMTTFYQRVNQLIDTERALAYDPFTVKRLRKLREERQRSRSASRLGIAR